MKIRSLCIEIDTTNIFQKTIFRLVFLFIFSIAVCRELQYKSRENFSRKRALLLQGNIEQVGFKRKKKILSYITLLVRQSVFAFFLVLILNRKEKGVAGIIFFEVRIPRLCLPFFGFEVSVFHTCCGFLENLILSFPSNSFF